KPMRLLLQAVGPRINHYYDRAWTAQDDRRSRLVVIGLKGLNRPAIERILAG
ncbi:GTP-binding protein, partial [Mesorhizobium sp.]